MSVEEKRAWFVLGVFAVAVATFLVLIPVVGARVAWGALGLFGFAGLTPLLFRKRGSPEEVTFDERDQVIVERATLAGGVLSYVWFVLACMVPWFVYMFRGYKTISIHTLPFVVVCGAIAFYVTRAATIVVLYGLGRSHAKE
jgi:hypothetical protein